MSLGMCFDCKTETDLLCPKCEKYFCVTHASVFNKRYCIVCGPNTSLGLEITDVAKSVNGVQHKGKQFKLIGEGWPDQIEKIRDLTDGDLEDKIVYYKSLLKEVVRTRDTLLITLSAIENESIGRKAKKVRGSGQIASGLHFTPSTDAVKTKSSNSESAADRAIKKLASSLGIDIERATKMYNILKKQAG